MPGDLSEHDVREASDEYNSRFNKLDYKFAATFPPVPDSETQLDPDVVLFIAASAMLIGILLIALFIWFLRKRLARSSLFGSSLHQAAWMIRTRVAGQRSPRQVQHAIEMEPLQHLQLSSGESEFLHESSQQESLLELQQQAMQQGWRPDEEDEADLGEEIIAFPANEEHHEIANEDYEPFIVIVPAAEPDQTVQIEARNVKIPDQQLRLENNSLMQRNLKLTNDLDEANRKYRKLLLMMGSRD